MAQKININFKKLVLAAVAFAFALPLFTSGNTFAAGNACTDGPTNRDALSTAIRSHNSSSNNDISTTIKLCGDISYSRNNSAVPSIDKGSVTIDLNGWSITNTNGGTALTVGRTNTGTFQRPNYVYGSLTIVGEGEVNGTVSNQYASNGASISLQGGTYTASNAGTYAANGYEAYPVNGKYVVAEEGLKVYGTSGNQVLEPEITADNFIVDPSEDSEGLFLRKGESGKIEVTLPDGSTSGVTFTLEYGEDCFTIDEQGNVTASDDITGWDIVLVSPTYEPTIVKEIYVTVFSVEPADDSEDAAAAAAETINDLLDNDCPSSEEGAELPESWQETLGEDAEETAYIINELIYEGDTVYTSVDVTEYEPTDEEVSAIKSVIKNVKSSNIKYYDVTISMSYFDYYDEEYVEFGAVHKLNRKAKIFLAEVTDPADGFKRTYYVVRYHDGEPELLTEGEDFIIEDGKIYLFTDKFSVFALGYKDSPIVKLAPDTGAAKSETGSASVNLSVVSVVAVASVALAGAAIFAKRK